MEILTFFIITLPTSSGAFRQRERVMLQTSCGAERVKCEASIIREKATATHKNKQHIVNNQLCKSQRH